MECINAGSFSRFHHSRVIAADRGGRCRNRIGSGWLEAGQNHHGQPGPVNRNAGVRGAAIETFEIARALAEVEVAPKRFRLRRLLRQALTKLRDRVGAPGLAAGAGAVWTLAEAA